MNNTHYDHLMMSYAAGALDEAQALIISAHRWYCASARSTINRYEDIGGYLIDHDCTPVQMSDHALDHVFGRIECEQENTRCHGAGHHEDCCKNIGCDLPEPISEALARHQQNLRWRSIGNGFEKLDVELDCRKSHAQFMKAAPAAASPEHSHGGIEITLVLDGSISDEYGHYKRGDLVITDERTTHKVTACPQSGCTCFVVSSAPIKLTGIASILNPFLRV